MQLTIECQKRPEGVNPRALRRQGLIPAALYGHKGTESVSLTVNEKDALVLLKNASVNNTLVDVNVPEMPWRGKALIREVQAHPWKKNLFHLSFFSIAAHGKLEVVIPVRVVGESSGVKLGGLLEQSVTELDVQCLPDRIPESIEVDISNLGIGESVSVKDLPLPEGVSALTDADRIVLSIMAPQKGEAE